MVDNARRWWCFELSSSSPDDAASTALELGCAGAQILSATEILAYFEGSAAQAETLELGLESQDMRCTRRSEVIQKSWAQQCESLLEPVRCQALTIHPVASSQDAAKLDRSPNTIMIIPGMGFGTGHHATTAMALNLLEDPAVGAHPSKNILDVGTGSGVLAIGAALRLGEHVHIDAIDIDVHALENARENIAINGLEERITIGHGTVPWPEPPPKSKTYDLIIANVYTEILCTMECHFLTQLRPGGLIILTGVMSALQDVLMESYAPSRWEPLAIQERDGWIAALLRCS